MGWLQLVWYGRSDDSLCRFYHLSMSTVVSSCIIRVVDMRVYCNFRPTTTYHAILIVHYYLYFIQYQMAAESEVSFGELDGSSLQIGVLRTRWNDEHVSNLVDGIKVNLLFSDPSFNLNRRTRCSNVQFSPDSKNAT